VRKSLTLFYMFNEMLNNELSEMDMVQMLRDIALRGETVEELIELVQAMRARVVPVRGHGEAIDLCGTGGSGLPRINTSTLASFVVAAAGVKVAKHGNRASGGRCGSFDVLEAVGCRIELGPEQVERTLSELGIGFMLAPLYHPVMKVVGQARKSLGIRTIFNMVGPLVNPAGVRRQVIGVSDPVLPLKLIEVLKRLDHERVMVVCGSDGLDELTLTGSTLIFTLDGSFELTPESVGLKTVEFEEISGGNVKENAHDFVAILKGEETGAKRDLVVLNAAAGLLVAGKVESMKEGVEMAFLLLSSGSANHLFEKYCALTHSL